MKCIEIKEHLETFLDDEIGIVLHDEIKLHLDLCKLCRAEFTELFSVSRLLKKELSAAPAKQLDDRIMTAFRQHHRKKSAWNWSAILAGIFAPKPLFALLTLCFLTGLAFLLGRITAPAKEIIVSNPQIIEKEIPTEVVKYVEVPITKYVEVPFEKIVTRIIYRKVENHEKILSPTIQAGNPANKTIESAQPLDLKDFQPLGEISPKILKKGESNEK